MNERRRMEIKVGTLVIVSLAAVFAFIWLLGDFTFSPVRVLYVDFNHTGGLKPGAAVSLSGVTIGKITDVSLVRTGIDGTKGQIDEKSLVGRPGVRVTAEIPINQFQAIPSDVTASIGSRSVLGEKHLELTPGPGGVSPLVDGAILEGRPPAGLEQAGDDAVDMLKRLSAFMDRNEDNLTDAIARVKSLAAAADEFLTANRASLDQAVENLRASSAGLAAATAPDGRLASTLNRVDRIARRFDGATGNVETELPRLVEKVNVLTAKAEKLVANMDKLVVDMTPPTVEAMKNINDIAGGIDSGRGTVGQLVTDRTLYDDIVSFVKDIKAKPWKLLWKK